MKLSFYFIKCSIAGLIWAKNDKTQIKLYFKNDDYNLGKSEVCIFKNSQSEIVGVMTQGAYNKGDIRGPEFVQLNGYAIKITSPEVGTVSGQPYYFNIINAAEVEKLGIDDYPYEDFHGY